MIIIVDNDTMLNIQQVFTKYPMFDPREQVFTKYPMFDQREQVFTKYPMYSRYLLNTRCSIRESRYLLNTRCPIREQDWTRTGTVSGLRPSQHGVSTRPIQRALAHNKYRGGAPNPRENFMPLRFGQVSVSSSEFLPRERSVS